MGSVNRTIVASVIIIMAAGIYHLFLQSPGQNNIIKSPLLIRIVVGGYMLGLFASLFDLIGFGIGQVAGWLLMLAVGVAVVTVISDLVTRFSKQQNSTGTTGGGGTPTLR
jgi:hypothetical protein